MSQSQRTYQDGETLFSQGDSAKADFTLLEGAVELLRNGENGPEPFGFIQPGETFGTQDLADNNVYVATARAIGSAVVEVQTRGGGGFSLDAILKPLTSLLTSLSPADNPPTMPSPGGNLPPRPKMGLFQRLFGTGEEIKVRVCSFRGGDAILSKNVAALLGKRPGIRVGTVKESIDALQLARAADDAAPVELVDPAPADVAMRHLNAITEVSRAKALKSGGDVLIWGHVTDQEHALTLYFTSVEPEDEDTPGLFADVTPLVLPLPVQPEWGELLYAAVLAAARPRNKVIRKQGLALLPGAMNGARYLINNLPYDLSLEDQARAQLTQANVTARVAALGGGGPLYAEAVILYRAALERINRDDDLLLWALTQRNLGQALQGLADAGGDSALPDLTQEAAWTAAAEAFRAAEQVLSKTVLALIWAAMENRLGMTLYKLDAKANEEDALKATINAYQNALQVFSNLQSPMKWAEVMHNLAQAAQVLGEQLRNKELLEKAVDACRAALKVRRQDIHPRLWAATQNNLGSALFLLGRTLKEREPLEQAAQSFAQVRDFHQDAGNEKAAAIAGRNLAHVEKILNAGSKAAQPGQPPRMKWEPADEETGSTDEAEASAADAPPQEEGDDAPSGPMTTPGKVD